MPLGAEPARNELAKAINVHLASEVQASHTDLAMSIGLRDKDLNSAALPRCWISRSLRARPWPM